MSRDPSGDARPLSNHEIFDLLRAGLVLIATVVLALMVPTRVLGADVPNDESAQTQSTRN